MLVVLMENYSNKVIKRNACCVYKHTHTQNFSKDFTTISTEQSSSSEAQSPSWSSNSLPFMKPAHIPVVTFTAGL